MLAAQVTSLQTELDGARAAAEAAEEEAVATAQAQNSDEDAAVSLMQVSVAWCHVVTREPLLAGCLPAVQGPGNSTTYPAHDQSRYGAAHLRLSGKLAHWVYQCMLGKRLSTR